MQNIFSNQKDAPFLCCLFFFQIAISPYHIYPHCRCNPFAGLWIIATRFVTFIYFSLQRLRKSEGLKSRRATGGAPIGCNFLRDIPLTFHLLAETWEQNRSSRAFWRLIFSDRVSGGLLCHSFQVFHHEASHGPPLNENRGGLLPHLGY